MPPVTFFISSWAAVSPFCFASFIAATIKSSVISFSSGFKIDSSIIILFIFPFAVEITLTKPPPDTPSTSIELSFSKIDQSEFISNFWYNKMSSHVGFGNLSQAKDAYGGASNFHRADLRLDCYEARLL